MFSFALTSHFQSDLSLSVSLVFSIFRHSHIGHYHHVLNIDYYSLHTRHPFGIRILSVRPSPLTLIKLVPAEWAIYNYPPPFVFFFCCFFCSVLRENISRKNHQMSSRQMNIENDMYKNSKYSETKHTGTAVSVQSDELNKHWNGKQPTLNGSMDLFSLNYLLSMWQWQWNLRLLFRGPCVLRGWAIGENCLVGSMINISFFAAKSIQQS